MTDYLAARRAVPASSHGAGVLPASIRDPLLTGVPAGAVRFLFDLDFSWCYPGGDYATRPAQGNPARGQTVYDVTGRANGDYAANTNVFDPPLATYAGGGFDYSTHDRNPYGVRGPVDAWAPIHAAAVRQFLVCGYYRMPTSGDWKPSGGYLMMFSSRPTNGFHLGGVEPFVIAQIGGNLRAARQTAVGTVASLDLTPTADHYGKMCQIAYWRTAAGCGFRMRSADGTVSITGATGTELAEDFSGLAPVWGDARTPNNGAYSAEDQAATNIRGYRGWLEDLGASTRDPLAVIDADWDRVMARKAASGGTIFA